MLRCVHCRRLLETSRAEVPPKCPYCGYDPLPVDEQTKWVPIARVNNLAEVGYFVDSLDGEEIESRIDERDDFDAVSGLWEKTFVIRVLEDQGQRAVSILRTELSESSDPDEDDASEQAATDGDARNVWMPLALILLAGGLVYLSARDRPPSPAQNRPGGDNPSLWRVLGETESVLQSERRPGRPYRAIRYDEGRRVLLLEEDLDGDGRLDRLREFKRGVLVEDRRN